MRLMTSHVYMYTACITDLIGCATNHVVHVQMYIFGANYIGTLYIRRALTSMYIVNMD